MRKKSEELLCAAYVVVVTSCLLSALAFATVRWNEAEAGHIVQATRVSALTGPQVFHPMPAAHYRLAVRRADAAPAT